MIDFWKLFPNNEHHFKKQADKKKVFAFIAETVRQSAGMVATKVKGGFALFPEEDE